MKTITTGTTRAAQGALIALACAAAFAGQTHIWTQGEASDYEKGVLKNLSLRGDGLVTLAPRSHELFDTSAAYLWALARDSKGNLYTAGGPGAKLFRIPPGGPGRLLAEVDALEIHALAVDSQDRVYFATAPDGKVYRVTGDAKPELFYDPKAKYIWALLFDAQGNLLIATGGGAGEIHKVTPEGKGTVLFRSEETHIRSLALDGAGNLIAGTDPGGLVLRVSPTGEGFVLYQMARKEVTAVAVARDGTIYAAGAGSKQAAPPSVAPTPLASPTANATAAINPPGAPAAGAAPRAVAAPPVSVGTVGVTGGSEVCRIDPNGNPRRVWNHAQDVVYALAFAADGRVLLGAGNKGSLYRIESPTLSTSLLNLPVTQITAFQSVPGGRFYAATGNTGKVYEIGPELEHEGTLESDVFDAGMYSLWGRLSFEAHLNGGQIALVTRSGNLDQPRKNWSPWSTPVTAPQGARPNSPAARFVQWKATLTADGAGHSPELESVDVAYLPKNVEPRLDEIEITQVNYRFPTPALSLAGNAGPAQTLNLPPLGRRAGPSFTPPAAENTTSTPTLQFAKGYLGARWLASDPNGDALQFSVEIRGVNETTWKPLKEKLTEKYFSWDSSAFPDGDYRLRVTATDAPGNPPAEALTASLESAPFTIDNAPPRISALAATRRANTLQVRWHAADALSILGKAEFSLDGGEWSVAPPVTKLSDSLELDYELNLDAAAGEHTIAVRVVDACDNQAVDKVVVK